MAQTDNPVIGVICDAFSRDGNADRLFHGVAEEYIHAITHGTSCIPLLIPVISNDLSEMESLCNTLDGLLLTGSRTNVHPERYDDSSATPDILYDLKRDNTAFQLIETTLEKKLPVFGICRGFQEINVALGGTLHQELTNLEGRQDHARHLELPQNQQYQASHDIQLTQDGLLHQLLGKSRITINSLHHQGVDCLADSLFLEGVADDGTPEAFRLKSREHFFIATQWHPEWHIATDPVSQTLFKAFDEAVHQYAINKNSGKAQRTKTMSL